MNETNSIIAKAALGIGSPAIGLTVSTMQLFEQWLRIGSLMVGIAVGLVTIYSILKRGKRKD